MSWCVTSRPEEHTFCILSLADIPVTYETYKQTNKYPLDTKVFLIKDLVPSYVFRLVLNYSQATTYF
jgi:hypothetical protein